MAIFEGAFLATTLFNIFAFSSSQYFIVSITGGKSVPLSCGDYFCIKLLHGLYILDLLTDLLVLPVFLVPCLDIYTG